MASARLSAAGLGHSEYDLRPTAARTARCPDAYDTSQRVLQPSGMGLRGMVAPVSYTHLTLPTI